jgi:hypothetical protein
LNRLAYFLPRFTTGNVALHGTASEIHKTFYNQVSWFRASIQGVLPKVAKQTTSTV